MERVFYGVWQAKLGSVSLRDPRSCLLMKRSSRISIEHKGYNNRDWDSEVNGSFLDKSCTIKDRQGNVVAKANS